MTRSLCGWMDLYFILDPKNSQKSSPLPNIESQAKSPNCFWRIRQRMSGKVVDFLSTITHHRANPKQENKQRGDVLGGLPLSFFGVGDERNGEKSEWTVRLFGGKGPTERFVQGLAGAEGTAPAGMARTGRGHWCFVGQAGIGVVDRLKGLRLINNLYLDFKGDCLHRWAGYSRCCYWMRGRRKSRGWTALPGLVADELAMTVVAGIGPTAENERRALGRGWRRVWRGRSTGI